MIISVEHINKEYKALIKQKGIYNNICSFIKPKTKIIKAVNDISFNVNEGEIVGFIGRNGAGKSTTIKMLTGILYPTSGRVLVNGIEPYKNKKSNAKIMGLVFGQRTQLWWDIPIIDTFSLLKEMYKIDNIDYKKRLDFFCDLFKMNDYLNKPVRQLSLGERMCADLCAAMLHNPKVIYLDEPTIGLDFVNKENIRNFLKQINLEFNTTIIITSHDIGDIEQLCNRVIIIDNGKIINDGSLNNLKNSYNSFEEISFILKKDKLAEFKEKFSNENVKINFIDNKANVKFNKNQYNKVDIMTNIIQEFNILDISIKETDLEDIIKQIYIEGIKL